MFVTAQRKSLHDTLFEPCTNLSLPNEKCFINFLHSREYKTSGRMGLFKRTFMKNFTLNSLHIASGFYSQLLLLRRFLISISRSGLQSHSTCQQEKLFKDSQQSSSDSRCRWQPRQTRRSNTTKWRSQAGRGTPRL